MELILLFVTVYVIFITIVLSYRSQKYPGHTPASYVSPHENTNEENYFKLLVRDRNDSSAGAIECLDRERLITLHGGDGGQTTVCADSRCVDDPHYFEIQHVKDAVNLGTTYSVPSILKRCDSVTLKMVYDRRHRHLEYRATKEYSFTNQSVYIDMILPSHLYTRVWSEKYSRWTAETVHPLSVRDLPIEYRTTGGKLRVRCNEYSRLLDFCRFSIHTHTDSHNVICCKRSCSRPEPLTVPELSVIRTAAKREPYYTCSWLEKRILFKWHVGKELFEPYWSFEQAIGVYSDVYNRFDPNAIKLFVFKNWKSPEESVSNADELYFKSPTNLAGYKWYEPSATDQENQERYEYTDSGGKEAGLRREQRHDETTVRVAGEVLNLVSVPHNFIISSRLVLPCSFDQGSGQGFPL